jgi:hypothetical protein
LRVLRLIAEHRRDGYGDLPPLIALDAAAILVGPRAVPYEMVPIEPGKPRGRNDRAARDPKSSHRAGWARYPSAFH